MVPWHLMLKQETAEQLRRFVESGGTLILETGFGMYDELTLFNPVIPPHGLADAFGYREGESFYIAAAGPPIGAQPIPPSDRVYTQGYLKFTDPCLLYTSRCV